MELGSSGDPDDREADLVVSNDIGSLTVRDVTSLQSVPHLREDTNPPDQYLTQLNDQFDALIPGGQDEVLSPSTETDPSVHQSGIESESDMLDSVINWKSKSRVLQNEIRALEANDDLEEEKESKNVQNQTDLDLEDGELTPGLSDNHLKRNGSLQRRLNELDRSEHVSKD
jgi:hypothetical protein